jgi:hypothetical protein
MAGIKETRELLYFVTEFGNAVGHSLADGKISVVELGNFIGALASIAPAFEGIGELKTELKDLDEAEKQELLDLVNDRFDIPQDGVEALIEKGLATGVAIAEFVNDILAATASKA